MRKLAAFIAAVALPTSFAGAAVIAPYTGSWLQTWDFSTGTQGFTATQNGSGVAFWNNGAGAGCLQTASTSASNNAFYSLDISTLGTQFGGWSATNGQPFVIQCDIMPVSAAGPGGSGISLVRTSDNKGPAVGGINGSAKAQAKDRSWDNSNRTSTQNVFTSGGSFITGKWYTIQLEYGFQNPGYWSAWVKPSVATDAGPANQWYQLGLGASLQAGAPAVGYFPVQPGADIFKLLRLGGSGDNGTTANGQVNIDNVSIVPEPASLGMLATGVGLLSLRRRRTR